MNERNKKRIHVTEKKEGKRNKRKKTTKKKTTEKEKRNIWRENERKSKRENVWNKEKINKERNEASLKTVDRLQKNKLMQTFKNGKKSHKIVWN